ncbi:hypothetical protein [Actinokineospora bangkokensis]|uniref:hypothetical protein n=1 Tax=Actinokineospora bangkokensis TaxID=1193682 RepID=UPI0011783215|nr:hypothetical protein [Actinokineospora bangkokensis]
MELDADLAAVARAHQGVIEAELRASRRTILHLFRTRLRADPTTLGAPEFLALADAPTVHAAIVLAARAATGAACALFLVDGDTQVPRVVRTHGVLRAARPALIALVAAEVPRRWADLRDGDPVPIGAPAPGDDPAGARSRRALGEAGLVDGHLYPLRAAGDVLGVLTTHYRRPGPHPPQGLLVLSAERALARSTPASRSATPTTVTVLGPLETSPAAARSGRWKPAATRS